MFCFFSSSCIACLKIEIKQLFKEQKNQIVKLNENLTLQSIKQITKLISERNLN